MLGVRGARTVDCAVALDAHGVVPDMNIQERWNQVGPSVSRFACRFNSDLKALASLKNIRQYVQNREGTAA